MSTQPDEPETWLDPSAASTLVGRGGGDGDASTAWVAAVSAARDYVEQHRSDLFVTTDGVPVFVPGDAVKLGTAMLASRWYERRSAPLGAGEFTEFGSRPLLRHDPDIAKLLGLGTESSSFVFGAGPTRRV